MDGRRDVAFSESEDGTAYAASLEVPEESKTIQIPAKTLQDFAENCCRTKEQQLHILLISQYQDLHHIPHF